MDLSETDLAYAAGIVDGEGCIHVYAELRRGYVEHIPKVVIEMAELPTIQWLSEKFEVSMCTVRKRQEHHKVTYRVSFRYRSALRFLRLIVPYLKAKRDQADKMLEFPYQAAKRRTEPLTEEVISKRQDILEDLRSLKRQSYV